MSLVALSLSIYVPISIVVAVYFVALIKRQSARIAQAERMLNELDVQTELFFLEAIKMARDITDMGGEPPLNFKDLMDDGKFKMN